MSTPFLFLRDKYNSIRSFCQLLFGTPGIPVVNGAGRNVTPPNPGLVITANANGTLTLFEFEELRETR